MVKIIRNYMHNKEATNGMFTVGVPSVELLF